MILQPARITGYCNGRSHGVQKYVHRMITKCTYKNGNVQIITLYQRTKSFTHTLIQVVKIWL